MTASETRATVALRSAATRSGATPRSRSKCSRADIARARTVLPAASERDRTTFSAIPVTIARGAGNGKMTAGPATSSGMSNVLMCLLPLWPNDINAGADKRQDAINFLARQHQGSQQLAAGKVASGAHPAQRSSGDTDYFCRVSHRDEGRFDFICVWQVLHRHMRALAPRCIQDCSDAS